MKLRLEWTGFSYAKPGKPARLFYAPLMHSLSRLSILSGSFLCYIAPGFSTPKIRERRDFMKHQFCVALTALALVYGISVPVAAQTKSTPKLKTVQMKEQHPEIAAAMMHLKEAKQNLEHAAHDFGGHRVTALKHVNEALEECRLALEADKK
jgi:hypothetical protein